MFNREKFHLVQPVPEGSLYTYVTADEMATIEDPEYFRKLKSNTNVREGDVVRVISDQGDTKYHAEFCFMSRGEKEPLVGVVVGGWMATTLATEQKSAENPVDVLLQAFRETPKEDLKTDGLPDKRKYARIDFTQDEWEVAVSDFAAEEEARIAETRGEVGWQA